MRVMKAIFATGWGRLLWIGMLALLSQSVYAYENWTNNWNSFEWDPEAGVIHCKIRYYQTWGGALDGHCGFDEGVTIRVGAEEVYLDGHSDDAGMDVRRCSSGVDWIGVQETGGSEKEYAAVFDVKVPEQYLNGQISYSINGKWWRRGTIAPDEQISHTGTISTPWSRTAFSTKSYRFGEHDGKPAVLLEWSRPRNSQQETDANEWGDIQLGDEVNTPLSAGPGETLRFAPTNYSGTFVLYPQDGGNYDPNNTGAYTYSIVQSYTPTSNDLVSYVTTTTNATQYQVPAYPQMEDFEASFNGSTRQIELSWSLPSAPGGQGQAVMDNFRINYSSTANAGNNAPSGYLLVPYEAGQQHYETTLTVAEGTDANFTFEIYRTETDPDDNSPSIWRKTYAKTTILDNVNANHMRPESLFAEFTDDGGAIKVTWTQADGGVWSDGTRVVLTRQNLTYGSSDDITLARSDYEKGEYIDEMIKLCNEYQYKMQIIPNDQYEGIAPIYTDPDKTLIMMEKGDLVEFAASKGYFGDRVELTWTKVGLFDEFSVERKEYGQDDSFYKKIMTEPSSSTSNDYVINDETAEPGKIYQYRVTGLAQCADTVLESDEVLEDIGFRTPTGDIYGRVTFENGQAEEGVEVYLESDLGATGQSLFMNASSASAKVLDTSFLSDVNETISLQAWVKRESGTGDFLGKNGMYNMGFNALGQLYFQAGNDKIVTDTARFDSRTSFMQVTAVKDSRSMRLYVDGKLMVEKTNAEVSVQGTAAPFVIGGSGFQGYVDEVRVWDVALDSMDIVENYNRYLVGNETGLIAYYTFDYSVERNLDNEGGSGQFFDQSYDKMSVYNEHHGILYNVGLSDVVPTQAQLGYRAYTAVDGSYAIHAIPYVGGGTAYTIIPRLGIHEFSPQREDRYINAGAQSHTVNFTDVSSFDVEVSVVYEGGTYPVEGVQFTIDGVSAMDGRGKLYMTDATGRVTLRVPVGTHEVKAVKNGHSFAIDGRLCDQDSLDLNYQDRVTGRVIEDITWVKYIGRVAGGVIQEEYPVGHSLSKNNLADNIKITLNHVYAGSTYDMVLDTVTKVYRHGPEYKADPEAKTNSVLYNEDGAVISVNNETGEFVAYLRPEKYTLKISATGHPSIPGNNTELNLTQSFADQYEVYEYSQTRTIEHWDTIYTYDYEQPILSGSDTVGYVAVDTSIISAGTEVVSGLFADSVRYNSMQKFIERVRPEVSIVQLDNTGALLDYYGGDELIQSNMLNEFDTIPLVSPSGDYLFGRPVFQQGKPYTFDISVFEGYRYNGSEDRVDRVPTKDAHISFTNEIQGLAIDTVINADSLGHATYTFQAGEPVIAEGIKSISAQVTIGSDGSQTSFPWVLPDNFAEGFAYVLGGKPTGTNFVTGGPDRMLTILRDPPGSSSYSYLEQGTTITKSSTYSGGIENEGMEGSTIGSASAVYQWHGVGSGVMNVAIEADNGTTVSAVHQESYTDINTKTTSTTTTTRFQTSDAPDYVGADADVYIGYATNLTFGQTDNVAVISRDEYEANDGMYDNVYAETADWVLVAKEGTSISENFQTLFMYPQRHIINVLIPRLESVRNSLLMPYSEYAGQIDALQAMANDMDTVFYLSYFSPTHPDYGKSNADTTITDLSHGNEDDIMDGPSYRVIYKNDIVVRPNSIVPLPDTINFLNQSIEAWEDAIASNEKAKIEAELMQNYSFQGGSNVEYSEAYTGVQYDESTFEIVVGVSTTTEVSLASIGIKTGLNIEEKVVTTQGGTYTDETEQSHAKGFVLMDDGTDYFSVDVMRERNSSDAYDTSNISTKTYYPSFIFKTRGGVSSCPYEDAEYSRYYRPGTLLSEATMSMENPYIYTDNDFLENVPCGEPARFTVYMTNESEANESVWFNLRIIDASNPYGAQFTMDGGELGNGRSLIVPNGEVLTKTIEIRKGAVLNYDSLMLVLESQCQPSDPTDTYDDIADTLMLHVHFTPSCTDVDIVQPSSNWTYNTKLPQMEVDGLQQYYMPVILGGFDVNYPDFDHIEIQYKPASESDDNYITLISYYNDSALYADAVSRQMVAAMMEPNTFGQITYNWFMGNLMDQEYDLRARSVCNINNTLVYTNSEVLRGIKDMYQPRLFGTPQPGDGILSAGEDIRVDFNEPIAAGYITQYNFQVTGVRNGTETDHSVAVNLDGIDDYLASEAVRNLTAKDFTVEMWINGNAQDAVLFSHGNRNDYVEFGITADNHLYATMNGRTVRSVNPFAFDQGTWAHVAMVYTADGYVSLYYNYIELLSQEYMGAYQGIGNIVLGRGMNGSGSYAGLMDNMRVWEMVRTEGELQLNSLAKLSGNETGLMFYCPMDEGHGTVIEDFARGANLAMYGCQWSMPEGRSTQFDGSTGYLTMNTSAAVVQSDMDFTIEFWFKAAEGSRSATMLSNGRGDGTELGGSGTYFSVGFDEDGLLYFANNGNTVSVKGDYADNDWHHVAITAGRVQGRLQIYMDGLLNTYAPVDLVGGIANSSMYAGVKAWYNPDDASTLHVDEFFNGALDEIRLWNVYKTATLIEENMYKRLDGDEIGLLAYYPFEYYMAWQGSTELEYTLQDQVVSEEVEDGTVVRGPMAVLTGTAIESADIAPIVDKGPVADLSFDFVVNDDALIITLGEPFESVEKTVVTISVDDIMDLNGNTQLSPITWTAYIDRNQLRWSQSEWTDTKHVYDEYEFTVDIVNTGGSVMNYTIENLPSWLSARPAQGVMQPSSTQHVTFTVRPDLNVGTYNEVIYLKDENNVGEPLELNLTVTGDVPQWEVNPSDFAYNMAVFGQLRFNNIFSDDENDMLAAFDGTQCVGVAHCVYNEEVDMWYAMLTVYGNRVRDSRLTFRMWDASTGIIYQAEPEEEILFVNDAIYGTPMEPVIFDGQTVLFQEVMLDEGWNWISFNLASEALADVNTALASGSWNSGDQIKVMQIENGSLATKFADYSAKEGRWKNAGFGLNNTNMYMLYTSAPQVLSLEGVLVNPLETPVTLKAGSWNYIGYTPNVNLTVSNALAGYEAREGDVVKSIDGFAMYSGNNWIGSLAYMEPNAGYMLLNTDAVDKTLYYPSASTVAGASTKMKASPFSSTMSIVAQSKLVDPADDLRVHVNGKERGKAVPVTVLGGRNLQFVSVAGDRGGDRLVFILTKADGTRYRSTNDIRYEVNGILGSLDNPYELSFEKETANQGDVRMRVSPNPAKDNAHVDIRLAFSAEIQLDILSQNGMLLYSSTQWVDNHARVDIDLNDFPAGNYIVKLTVSGETYVEKLIKF